MLRLVLVMYLLFAGHHLDTFGLLALRSTRCGNTCVGGQDESKIQNLISKKDETAVHGSNPTLPSFVHVGVTQGQIFHVVSALLLYNSGLFFG